MGKRAMSSETTKRNNDAATLAVVEILNEVVGPKNKQLRATRDAPRKAGTDDDTLISRGRTTVSSPTRMSAPGPGCVKTRKFFLTTKKSPTPTLVGCVPRTGLSILWCAGCTLRSVGPTGIFDRAFSHNLGR